MTQKYWEQFQATGKIEDYLCYKMDEVDTTGQNHVAKQAGATRSESDCSDRHGAFDSAYR